MFSTVLFDLDGTLVPSLELWIKGYQYAFIHFGLELSEEFVLDHCFHRDYGEMATEFGLSSGEELGQQVELGLAQAFNLARLYPMAGEVLEWCREAGLSLGLVTSASRPQATLTLSRLGITQYFDVVVTGDDITRYKPHPEPVLLALKQLKQSPYDSLMVGDYLNDILAGQAAGTRTALFLPDEHSRFYELEELKASEPDFIFTHHSELLAYLVEQKSL